MTKLGALGRDRRGAAALIFALLLLPICWAVGIAVDYSRLAHARQIMQDAVDAAALAGAAIYIDDTPGRRLDVTQVATNTFVGTSFPGWITPQQQPVQVTPNAHSSNISDPKAQGGGGCQTPVGQNGDYQVTVEAHAKVDVTVMAMFSQWFGASDVLDVKAAAVNPLSWISICNTNFSSDAEDWNTAYIYKIPQYGKTAPPPGSAPNGWYWQYLPTQADLFEIGGNCLGQTADPKQANGSPWPNGGPYGIPVASKNIPRRCFASGGKVQGLTPSSTTIELPATQPFGMALKVMTAGNDGTYEAFKAANGGKGVYYNYATNTADSVKAGTDAEFSDQDYPFGYTGQYNQGPGDTTWFYSGLISGAIPNYPHGLAPSHYIDGGQDPNNQIISGNQTVFGRLGTPAQTPTNAATGLAYPLTGSHPTSYATYPHENSEGGASVSFQNIQNEQIYTQYGSYNCSLVVFNGGYSPGDIPTGKCMEPDKTVGGWAVNQSCAQRHGATYRYMWNDMGARLSSNPNNAPAVADDFNYLDLVYDLKCSTNGAYRVHLIDLNKQGP